MRLGFEKSLYFKARDGSLSLCVQIKLYPIYLSPFVFIRQKYEFMFILYERSIIVAAQNTVYHVSKVMLLQALFTFSLF